VYAKVKETSGGKGEVMGAEIDPAKTTLDPKKIDASAWVAGGAGFGGVLLKL
jgi:hypothetical protein